jgi:predicted dehydrogenase
VPNTPPRYLKGRRWVMDDSNKRQRVALVGTGHRGAGMWGKELLAGWREQVDMVALCEVNAVRAENARNLIGTNAPIYADIDQMLAEMKPDVVIVCTRDDTHDEIIVKALEAGARVITEKPMTTTLEKAQRILDAEKRTGGHIDVTFNYRFAPTAKRIKELLLSGVIGEVSSVDFHWYLDTQHGADYFRRWHAYEAHSGSLFVHKSTHHFDLLNWYLDADPAEVFAFGAQRRYGKTNPFRGENCRSCEHTAACPFYLDLRADPWLKALYDDAAAVDGYYRDACVFREDIDIPDTMVVSLRYDNGVMVSYSLNTFMPIEGHHLAFNGTKGRIEIRQYERQAWDTPAYDEILLIKNFGDVERIQVPHAPGGHYGGDNLLRNLLFKDGIADPLGQRAGARAGAMSLLVGVSAAESAKTGKLVHIPKL